MLMSLAFLLKMKSFVFALWFAALFVLERLWPQDKRALPDMKRWGRNGGLGLVNAVLSSLLVVPASLWAASVETPYSVGMVPGILLLDAWIYWWHRANHEIPFLWRFHQIHHFDRFLDSTSAVRFHFGEVFLSALVRVPVIIVLGLSIETVIMFEILMLAASLFNHSNITLPPKVERALSWVIVTPSIHWVHHHAARADTDSHYATIFSLWDRLWGSRSQTIRNSKMVIGVEGQKADLTLWALLWRPFRK
jgi:sterol desaturase/sphingolipid hydroxylase (fatty acid hydroxylase superfamily)